MTEAEFNEIKERVIEAGYGDEIKWSENLKPCVDAEAFCCEYVWVVVNAGMKNQIARKIYIKITNAIASGTPIVDVFGHKSKANAIDFMVRNREKKFAQYQKAEDKLSFLKSLFWIGDITKYHLAKNLGVDCAKPDRHLTRLAEKYHTTVKQLCQRLSEQTGLRIATIDVILWRAANLKLKSEKSLFEPVESEA